MADCDCNIIIDMYVLSALRYVRFSRCFAGLKFHLHVIDDHFSNTFVLFVLFSRTRILHAKVFKF
jgi:hypothetical protein